MIKQNDWADKLPAVNKCKRFYRKRYINTVIMLLFFEIVLVYCLLNSYQRDGWGKYFVAFTLFLFVFWTINLIIRWIKSFSWKIDSSYRGVLIRKSRYSKDVVVKQSSQRRFFLIVKIENIEMEGQCLFSTYRTSQVGDEILLFTMGTKELFAVNIEDQK